VSFKGANSLRTQLGARATWSLSDDFSIHAGGKWQHEFDGGQRSSSRDGEISVPTLKGDTFVEEFGVTYKPSEVRPLSLDLNLQGFQGVRQGIGVTLQFRWDF
jgi:outer membrane autotransporter protein